MSNISDPHIVFTKDGELVLSFKGTKENILLKDVRSKSGNSSNKMGFLISLFDLPVEMQEDITFNQILHNLKFFEKEFEVLFSEIKAPKNNTAAQKIFELLRSLDKDNLNFLNIMNEEKNILAHSLLKNNLNQAILEFIGKKKEFKNNQFNIVIKKVVTEKQTIKTIQLGQENIEEKQISLNTKIKIYKNEEIVDLKDISPIDMLLANVILDNKAKIQYIISFEDVLKCLFKDLLIFRSKEEIKIWKENISKYQNMYTKNVIYLNEVKSFLKGENMFNDEFGKGEFSKPFGLKVVQNKNSKENVEYAYLNEDEGIKEKLNLLGFVQITNPNENSLKKNTKINHLKLIALNENVVSEKSVAAIRRIK